MLKKLVGDMFLQALPGKFDIPWSWSDSLAAQATKHLFLNFLNHSQLALSESNIEKPLCRYVH